MSQKHMRGFVPGCQGLLLLLVAAVVGFFGYMLLPWRVFGLLLIGLAVFFLIVTRLAAPSVTSGYGHRARRPRKTRRGQPAHTARADQPHDAPTLEDAAPGACWQCGKKLRAGTLICRRCGAAQRKAKSLEPLTTGIDLPPGTFAPEPPAQMYQPGRPDPLA